MAGGENSWYDPYLQYAQPADAMGHGTQVMGVLVGGNASGFDIGVAPDAQWISVKIFRDDATATLSAIHAGFQWLLDPDGDPLTDDAPDIVNNSWGTYGHTGCSTEFHADIDALKAVGIEVVFSAGNAGPADNSLYSPADYAEVISVGAIDAFMNVPDFSSRGPSSCSNGYYPQLLAPGFDIYTADLSHGLGTLLNPYTTVEGTSFSSPHIAGIIALLKSAMPAASMAEIQNALQDTALDLGVPGVDNVNGYGLVDADAALSKLQCPTGTLDQDADGVYDECDNCILRSNALQVDADSDGYGNACDADFSNDGNTGSIDIAYFRQALSTGSLTADFNEDGKVGSFDIATFRHLLLAPPGPSAFVQ